MAERRMMAKSVIDTDKFMDMPLSTQALYFHLLLRADDDGFIKNPKTIKRSLGCSDDDLKLLIDEDYILTFDSGVIVIKHWKTHNIIRKDMYRSTECEEEVKLLSQTSKGDYVLTDLQPCNEPVTNSVQPCNEPVTNSVQTCNEPVTSIKVSIGKDSIGKDSSSRSIKESTKNKVEAGPVRGCTYDDSGVGMTTSLEYWNANYPPLTSGISEQLNDLIVEHGDERVLYALKEGASAGVRTLRYVKAICEADATGNSKRCRDSRKGKNKQAISADEFGKELDAALKESDFDGW